MLRSIRTNFRKVFKKRKGAGLATEIAGYILASSILLAIGVYGIRIIIDGVNSYRAGKELETIAAAAQAFEFSAKSSQPPADLGKLVSGLSASESTTGEAKANFVTKETWTSDASSFLDPWGSAYQYDRTNRTITTLNNGKTARSVSF